jgi:hypothetical protein
MPLLNESRLGSLACRQLGLSDGPFNPEPSFKRMLADASPVPPDLGQGAEQPFPRQANLIRGPARFGSAWSENEIKAAGDETKRPSIRTLMSEQVR